MKITKIIVNLLLCLWGLTGFTQQKAGYMISGNIKGVPDGTAIYLIRAKAYSGGADTIGRAKSEGGKFRFIGNLAVPGEFHWVKIDQEVLEKGKRSDIALMMDHSKIELNGNLSSWPEVQILGSKPTDEYLAYLKIAEPAIEAYKKLVTAKNVDSNAIKSAIGNYRNILTDYLTQHNAAYFSCNLILNADKVVMSLEDKCEAYTQLSESAKKSFYGLKLKVQLMAIKNASEISVGKALPDFLIKGVDGKDISMKEAIGKSKYTLLDFWAYWCGPCRKDIPNVKKAYETFKDKGFNVLSISIDPNVAAWKKALGEEQMPWEQGLDNVNASKLLFNISTIPAYVLVNDKGVIIATDLGPGYAKKYSLAGKNRGLHGEDLHLVLADLLGKDGK